MVEQTGEEIAASLAVNFANVVRICEQVLAREPLAQIVVIGSESAYKDCYDQTYGLAKAAVHRYVEMRKVSRRQQLVAVAPTIIADSGMTRRRHDYPDVLEQRRTVTAAKVAKTVHWLLYEGRHITNCIVPC